MVLLSTVKANLLCQHMLTCMPEIAHKTIPWGTCGLAVLRTRGSIETRKTSVLSCMCMLAPEPLVSGTCMHPLNSWPSCMRPLETQKLGCVMECYSSRFQCSHVHEGQMAGMHVAPGTWKRSQWGRASCMGWPCMPLPAHILSVCQHRLSIYPWYTARLH